MKPGRALRMLQKEHIAKASPVLSKRFVLFVSRRRFGREEGRWLS